MLGRKVEIEAKRRSDFAFPLRNIAGRLEDADLVFINLENPIIDNCPSTSSGFVFCASPETLQGLTLAGVDVVSLGNNHAKNYGQKGIESTLNYLGKVGIEAVGLTNLVIKEMEGIKYGFLGFDLVFRDITDDELNLVLDSETKVDVLIVGVHWGDEYRSYASSLQKSIAKKLVKKGADVIVGHHPHWIQDFEYIDAVPVYYSLGNLVFDQMWSEETKKGLLVELKFEGEHLVDIKEYKTYIKNWGEVEIMNGF